MSRCARARHGRSPRNRGFGTRKVSGGNAMKTRRYGRSAARVRRLNQGPEADTLVPMSTSRPSAPPDGQFAFELLKLLLQVAWADDEVAPAEIDALLAYGRKSLLSQDKLELVGQCLASRAP